MTLPQIVWFGRRLQRPKCVRVRRALHSDRRTDEMEIKLQIEMNGIIAAPWACDVFLGLRLVFVARQPQVTEATVLPHEKHKVCK